MVKESHIKLYRSDAAIELLKDKSAFLLLTQIALRAGRTESFNVSDLKPGEALVGDFKPIGLSRQNYRSALQRLGNRIIQRAYNIREEKFIIKAIADAHVSSGEFIFDNKNDPVFAELLKYYNRVSEFEKNDYRLQKGLMIAGNIGSGKSIMMKIFKDYCFRRKLDHQFRIEFADVIPDKYARHGYDGINLYTENAHMNNYGVYTSNPIHLCIDDLGVEKESVKYFGSEETVIEKVLTSRYNLFQEGYITHATTNLDAKMLLNKYGDRIYSRFKEMFNFIVLSGKDRRK